MRESDIMHETLCGQYWVGRDKGRRAYIVYKVGATIAPVTQAMP